MNDAPDIIGNALVRLAQIERAARMVGGAVLLELGGREIDEPSGLDAATREQLGRLGVSAMKLSDAALQIARLVGESAGMDVSLLQAGQAAAEQAVRPSLPPPLPQASVRPAIQPSLAIEPNGVRQPTSGIRSAVAAISLNRENKSEQRLPDEGGRLYQAIVPAHTTPKVELPDGVEPINIRIISDTEIVVGGERVTFYQDSLRLFVFNAFMLLRGRSIAVADIKACGFGENGHESSGLVLTQTVLFMRKRLEDAAGVVVIGKSGNARGARYAVNPAVVLIDERPEHVAAEDAEIVKKN